MIHLAYYYRWLFPHLIYLYWLYTCIFYLLIHLTYNYRWLIPHLCKIYGTQISTIIYYTILYYGDASVRMRTQRSAERMPVVSENWHAWQGNKIGVMSSWQYYGQIWGACTFFAFTSIIKQADKDQTGGSLFSLAIMSEYSHATWTNEMHTF